MSKVPGRTARRASVKPSSSCRSAQRCPAVLGGDLPDAHQDPREYDAEEEAADVGGEGDAAAVRVGTEESEVAPTSW